MESQENSCLAKTIKILDEYKDFNYPKDPRFLIPFLRVRKYDVDAAVQTVFNYFKNRKAMLKGMNLLPKNNIELLRYNYGGLLKNRDPLGRPIYIHKGIWNIKDGHTYDDLARRLYLTMVEILYHPEVQDKGLVFVGDYSQLSWTHCKEFSISRSRNLCNLQNACPLQIKQVHIVKNPWLYEMLYSVAKPFLKDKIKQRVQIHGHDLSLFHEALPKSILPASYGGDLTDEEAYDMDFIENIIRKNEFHKEFLGCGYKEDRLFVDQDPAQSPSICRNGISRPEAKISSTTIIKT